MVERRFEPTKTKDMTEKELSIIAVCCPVCRGKTVVPNGFYSSVSESTLSGNASPEKCISCDGKGYLILSIAEEKKKEAIEFAKWLRHTDNGTEHYNPITKETSETIGFSPYDCWIDDLYTDEELYQKFKEDNIKK